MAEKTTLARPYARAVFQTASAAGALAEWSLVLNALAQVLADPTARSYLGSPGLTDGDRVDFLAGTASEAVGDGAILNASAGNNFLRLLTENDRLQVLPEIAHRFDILKAEAERTVEVSMVAAVEVEAGLAKRIAEALEKKLGRAVELKLSVDPDLIGGAVIRAEDRVIDGSVRSRLESLANVLVS